MRMWAFCLGQICMPNGRMLLEWLSLHLWWLLCLCSLQDKLRAILQATYTHSSNLACFVFIYKGLCTLQSHVQGKTYQVHSFLAAFIGSLLVFTKNNNINNQVKILFRDGGWRLAEEGWNVVQVLVGGGSWRRWALVSLLSLRVSPVPLWPWEDQFPLSFFIRKLSSLLDFHGSQNQCICHSLGQRFLFFKTTLQWNEKK